MVRAVAAVSEIVIMFELSASVRSRIIGPSSNFRSAVRDPSVNLEINSISAAVASSVSVISPW